MITVIGLGPMGQAMVRGFRKAGHEVTVWNRTQSRAEGLDAVVAPTVKDALDASELVILSLTDYKAMYDILDGQAINDKVIVNLSSDTPDKTRDAAKWAADNGATFIDGGIMVPADLVATDASYVYYSGPEGVLRAYEPVLRLIGRVDYVGEQHGLAQMYYQAQLTVIMTSLSSYMHATAMLASAGVSPEAFTSYASESFQALATYTEGAATNMVKGEHPGDVANVTMMAATAEHILETSRQAGLDLKLPEAVKWQYDRAIAKGHGRDSWTSLYEVIKP
ncbi:6-phosphogluconate dehydrogenase [Kibdelosporangium aridum]|uniref:6-phosphogluconate dehydrogenase n=1 Tax=Kibdelosporangium aridum TaxID=2030 RepID=A0A428Z5W5_KIBAR|nr:NAD(P)-binding domain-containing protein [Kibdelosporangium aridum]RSM82486.1 6-phosphogluconate dehydrogenase [Kibdelosporangium aridum]